jgi:chromosome segregation ATPase
LSLETIAERLAKFEELAANNKEDIGNHNERITNLESKNESMVEFKTILKMQMEVNKEQNIQMKEMSKTLNNVNTNLTELNTSSQQLNSRLTDVEETLDANKIDIVKWIKNASWLIFIAFVLWKLGLK